MRKILTILISLLILHHPLIILSQVLPLSTEQQLENLADADQAETEDDTYLQELEHFRKNPVNLNTAEAEELKQLRIITDLQIANLISYRNLLGKLINIYELQAVPSWDVSTIKKILPLVTVSSALPFAEDIGKRFRGGEHSLLLRLSQVLEKANGYEQSTPGTKYMGSQQRIFFRYRYSYKNLLQFGLVGDKDAGEQFLKGVQKFGFDFYSFHFFIRKVGIIQSLAVGDFTVNMGQGLIQWQSLAFKKSVDVMGVKRQSAVLRPYNSAGEFNFHRGAGITIKKGRIEATTFISFRKLSANFTADTALNEEYISSFLTSGYHRTANEAADRNSLSQTAAGGNIIYRGNKWHTGVHGIYHQFSYPVQKRDEPYNLYAISGKSWHNLSIDYSYTYKNLHLFGEAAVDKNFSKAFVNGVLISVDPTVDISIVQRTINASYQAVAGNAFTENTYPVNETGFYTGISIRPAPGWKLDAYADIFKFPWLKYLVDAPGNGKDFLVQLTYTPNRQVEIYTRFKTDSKPGNQPNSLTATNYLVLLPRQNWRTQINFKINPEVFLRNRVELMWYDKAGDNTEKGFLAYTDVGYKPMLKPFSGIIRLQYFETDDYNSRIYAYENDVLYSYSIPAFNDKGFRWYININYDWRENLSFWFRLAQTIYKNKESIGSGSDAITGNRKTELKLQVRWLF